MTECCCEAFTVATIGVLTANSVVPDIEKVLRVVNNERRLRIQHQAGVSLQDLETGVDKNAVLRDDVADNVQANVTEIGCQHDLEIILCGEYCETIRVRVCLYQISTLTLFTREIYWCYLTSLK